MSAITAREQGEALTPTDADTAGREVSGRVRLVTPVGGILPGTGADLVILPVDPAVSVSSLGSVSNSSRSCRDCGKPITASSTGRCRSCGARAVTSDPAIVAARNASRARTMADPTVRQRYAAACAKSARVRMQDPAVVERLRLAGHQYGAQNLRKPQSAESRAQAGRAIQRVHLAWCPEEFWPLNATLKRQGHRLPARQQIIAERVAARERLTMDVTAAANFLQRIAPVHRCSADGAAVQIGATHWRYGARVLDRDAVLVLALSKGWNPDAWKMVA